MGRAMKGCQESCRGPKRATAKAAGLHCERWTQHQKGGEVLHRNQSQKEGGFHTKVRGGQRRGGSRQDRRRMEGVLQEREAEGGRFRTEAEEGRVVDGAGSDGWEGFTLRTREVRGGPKGQDGSQERWVGLEGSFNWIYYRSKPGPDQK